MTHSPQPKILITRASVRERERGGTLKAAMNKQKHSSTGEIRCRKHNIVIWSMAVHSHVDSPLFTRQMVLEFRSPYTGTDDTETCRDNPIQEPKEKKNPKRGTATHDLNYRESINQNATDSGKCTGNKIRTEETQIKSNSK